MTFTRSRPYQKTDSAHVEQKNGALVRPLIGDDRYASKAAYTQLAPVYAFYNIVDERDLGEASGRLAAYMASQAAAQSAAKKVTALPTPADAASSN